MSLIDTAGNLITLGVAYKMSDKLIGKMNNGKGNCKKLI